MDILADIILLLLNFLNSFKFFFSKIILKIVLKQRYFNQILNVRLQGELMKKPIMSRILTFCCLLTEKF